jgi:O-antigen/teichoic acid export membrane protein
LAFSLPLLPYSFCFWLIGVGDRYVIGHFLGATQVGLYSVAYGLGSIVQLLYMPLVVVLFPAITYLYENSMLPQIKTLCKYTLKFFLSLAIPAAFGLLILSKPLLRILTTQEFTKTSSIVSIVAFGTVFYSCSYIFSDLLMLFKKTKLVSFIFAGSASLNLLLNIMLVPLLGIMGAAISTLVTFGIHLVALSILTRRQITFDFDWKFLGKCLASSVLMDVIVWKLDPTSVQGIVISIMIGASIYLAFLIFLKGFNQGERAFLRNLIKRQFPSS